VADLAGKTLGKYRLIEQLGRGGFASVYKAYQPRLDRYVAVKVLHPHLVEGEDFLARFEREAKAVAGLRHPRIIIVHDFDVDDNTYFMVMEFIEGQSLKERMEELTAAKKHMPLAEVQRIIDDVASALDYAHGRGMLHRDIKPSNVVINKSGDSFLADFGIARILSNTQFTATGALIGTPAYMSPEQGQGLSVSSASDVYSLGVMLYELLVGRVPFDADTPLAIIFKHISDALPSVRAFRPELPEALERVTYKALAKHPEDRYQKPGELAQALRDALASEHKAETVARTPEPAVSEPPPVTIAVETPGSESAKAATLAVEREAEEKPGEALEEAYEAAELESMKAATVAVERGMEADFDGTIVALDDSIPSPDGEPEPKVELAETVVEGAAKPKKAAPIPKKKGLSKPLKIGGIALIGLILVIVLGVVLFNVFSPDEKDSTSGVAQGQQVTLTKKSTNTPKPKPTENLGLTFFEQGMVLLHDKQDYGGAIDQFNKAIQSGFKDPDVYYNRGWACHEWTYYEGKCSFERAIEDYDQAIKLDPNQAYFYGDRAWSYIHIGNFEAALLDYSKAIALEPDNPHFWNGKADTFSRLGKYEEALEAINRAIKIDAQEPHFYDTRAWVYTHMGDLESAIKDWSVAIVLDPENPEFWRERAWRKYDMGAFQGAIEDFSRAIYLKPDDVWLYVGRAHAYTRSGDRDAAIRDLDTMVEIEPNNADIYVQRGHVFVWMENPDSAVEAFQRALELNPENWEAHVKLGEIYYWDYHNIDRSLEHLNNAIELAPPDVDWPLNARGSIYNDLGRWEEAIADFNRALRISPNFQDLYGHRGYAYQELGDKDKARTDYERFMELTADMPQYDGWRKDIEQWLRNNP
jgi:tetratricopeptide (TPR) repeat protein/predicted Ser/Thr protein kinase